VVVVRDEKGLETMWVRFKRGGNNLLNMGSAARANNRITARDQNQLRV
jgi:hypothetical protein